MVKVELANISKNYDNIQAVKKLNLTVEEGEYLAVLGPTGSGKTTTMYLIAGLIQPSSGKILFDDEDITKIPAEDRNIGFVFEEYNLFPRMKVEENVIFGPIVKNLELIDSIKVAKELFELLNITGKEENFPNEISGGQKQRVALARAIVSNAKLLVMDDPLRALDAKIREILQVELRKLVEDLGLTCIHATHDTHEAMRVADRIAVFKDGQIVQIGTPEEVYINPVSIYVADFLGETSQFTGVIERKDSDSWLVISDEEKIRIQTELEHGTAATALIPAELVDILPLSAKEKALYDNVFEAKIVDSKCIGEFNEIELNVFSQTIKGKELIGKPIPLKKNAKVLFVSDKDDYRIFPLSVEGDE